MLPDSFEGENPSSVVLGVTSSQITMVRTRGVTAEMAIVASPDGFFQVRYRLVSEFNTRRKPQQAGKGRRSGQKPGSDRFFLQAMQEWHAGQAGRSCGLPGADMIRFGQRNQRE
jgi:hypothetical protein